MKPKPKEVWWIRYRRRQKRRSVSFEMVFRRAFAETFREYVDNCSIAGVKQMWDPKIGTLQRLTWVVIFCIMLTSMVYYLHNIWYESLGKPLIVTMESSTYPISKIDFPAVALCNINRISKKALINFSKGVHSFAKHNESLAEVYEFCSQLGRLIDYTYNASLRNHPLMASFNAYMNSSRQIINVMKMLAPSCDEQLLMCYWAGKLVDCKTAFSVRRTPHGHCCVFNYILAYDSADKPDQTLDNAKKQSQAGLYNGLALVVNPMVEDYHYRIYNMMGFEILLFDPTHFPDPSGGRVIQRSAQPDQVVMIKVTSTKQIATTEVRKYPQTTRKCLFHDERQKKFSNMYSYSACIVSCRIRTIQSLCKCTPFYLPVLLKQKRVCSYDDLKCLNKYKEKFFYLYPMGSTDVSGLEIELVDSLLCPDCLPDCEHTQHFTEHLKLPLTKQQHKRKHLPAYFL
ncbi:unnamed protein product [Leptosia nina]|uniref:Sodium channel protein Nach n=1 Tax=Leptosia nina TaxID=320188 RepID=A0AAV1JSN3_9NEOP